MLRDLLKFSKKIAGIVLPDKTYVKLNYRLTMGKPLNLSNPALFSEKLQWIKLYDHNPLYTTMVDKQAAKKYVADKIGSKYVVPLHDSWNSADEIDFDKLPDKFVLKVTHDSGGHIICKDKSKLDVEQTKKALSKALRYNYFRYSREWPYKNVKPRIIAEQFLEGLDGMDIPDYKVLCFDGKPRLIELHKKMFSKEHTQDFYDTDWNLTAISQTSMPTSGVISPKPECLDEMLKLSEVLSEGIKHVRVDWYYSNNQLYFGELTFFDSSGCIIFENPNDDKMLGELIKL